MADTKEIEAAVGAELARIAEEDRRPELPLFLRALRLRLGGSEALQRLDAALCRAVHGCSGTCGHATLDAAAEHAATVLDALPDAEEREYLRTVEVRAMQEQIAELEQQIAELEQVVAALDDRVAVIEDPSAAAAPEQRVAAPSDHSGAAEAGLRGLRTELGDYEENEGSVEAGQDLACAVRVFIAGLPAPSPQACEAAGLAETPMSRATRPGGRPQPLGVPRGHP